MSASEDYLLRQIALLRQFIAQMLAMRQAGKHSQALQVMVNAQERLFACRLSGIASLDIEEQLLRLSFQETPETATEKQLGYSLLLREGALTYRDLGRDDLATSAFALALHVALRTAETDTVHRVELSRLIDELRLSVSPEALHEPTRELLRQWDGLAS